MRGWIQQVNVRVCRPMKKSGTHVSKIFKWFWPFFFFSTLLKLKFVFVQRSERIAMKTWNFTGPWLQKFTLLLSPWTLGLLNPSNSRFFWNAIYRLSQQRTFIFKPHGKKKLKLVLIRKGPRVKSLHSTFSSTLHYGMYFGRSLDVRKNFYLCTDVSICL